MMPAVLKLCCGICHPHSRILPGLKRAALSAVSQELRLRPSGGCRRSHNAVEDGVFQAQGAAALDEALRIVESRDGWELEALEKNGDVIYSKVVSGSRKVFRLEAELDASADELHDILFFRVEQMHEWNPSVTRIKVLKHVGRNTMVTHEVSAETAGNLIGQRDFLSVRHWLKRGTCVYLGGAATRFESLPPQPGFVRAEDGPTCIILQPLHGRPDRSHFVWLLNMDVKGWLPQSLVNKALPRAQMEFTKNLRAHVARQHSHRTTHTQHTPQSPCCQAQ